MRTTFKKTSGKGVEVKNSSQQRLPMEDIASDNMMVNSISSEIENDSDVTMHSLASSRCGGSGDDQSSDDFACLRRG